MTSYSADQPVFRLRIAEQCAVAKPAACDSADAVMAAANKFRDVDAVVFDMGDVLFDATAWRRSLLQLLRRMGLQAGYRSLFSLWDREYLDAVHRGEREYGEAFVAFLRDTGLTGGQIDEVLAASHRFKVQLESETQLFPGIRETLQELQAQGLRLGVLSDSESTSTSIRRRLHGFGISESFSSIVSSIELKQTKPHPSCYLTALEQLRAEARKTVFVGHDSDELHGARRCAMKTIAFNYDRDAVADCRIGRFRDLALLLGRRRSDDMPLSEAA